MKYKPGTILLSQYPGAVYYIVRYYGSSERYQVVSMSPLSGIFDVSELTIEFYCTIITEILADE